MAKKDTFFIRAEVNLGHDGTFTQAEIDLGSYVNVGVKSSTLLRIHGVQTAFTDANGLSPQLPANTAASLAYQLTTESQGGMVRLSDKSVVGSGCVGLRNPDGSPNPASQEAITDNFPQDFVEGYLIAVDTLYLAGVAEADFATDVIVSIAMEVTMEKATQAGAASLALSQQ
tara:strand:+ start:794 stop:1309 length:516 start_codon:yes stop_codon:yes gene_type:complete